MKEETPEARFVAVTPEMAGIAAAGLNLEKGSVLAGRYARVR